MLRTGEFGLRRRNGSLPVDDISKMTPRYTVMNCLGMERMAAIEKVMIPMPHVAKTAVVTGPEDDKNGYEVCARTKRLQ
jgi:hypothetical protein